MWTQIKRFLKEEDGFWNIVAPIAGGLLGALGSRSAARTQAAAADQASQVQRDIYNQTRSDLSPFRVGGQQAFNTVRNSLGSDFRDTPGYQFGLEQGLGAIEGSAAARGNLLSGATLQGLQSYAQDYATNQYNNWIGQQMNLGQMGQAAAAQQANQGQNFANAQSNILAQGANASAAGTVGATNNLMQGINNAVGVWNYQNPPTAG